MKLDLFLLSLAFIKTSFFPCLFPPLLCSLIASTSPALLLLSLLPHIAQPPTSPSDQYCHLFIPLHRSLMDLPWAASHPLPCDPRAKSAQPAMGLLYHVRELATAYHNPFASHMVWVPCQLMQGYILSLWYDMLLSLTLSDTRTQTLS